MSLLFSSSIIGVGGWLIRFLTDVHVGLGLGLGASGLLGILQSSYVSVEVSESESSESSS